MKRSNIIGIIAAAVVIIVSVVLISWYLRKTTPMLIQGTVECTTKPRRKSRGASTT